MRHLMILNESYGVGRWGMDKRIVPSMVDAHFIDVQSSYFKMSKKNRMAWEWNTMLTKTH